MTTTHTPGPWFLNNLYISSGSGTNTYDIADVGCAWNLEKRAADTALICAAPDLLTACRAILNDHPNRLSMLRAAIAKATLK